MREKLIELLDEIQRFGAGYTDFELYGMRVPDEVFNEEVADHLIANGVTVTSHCKGCERVKVDNKLTNADHIRAMSDEELAEFLSYGCPCPTENCRPSCVNCIGNWLKNSLRR